MDTEAGPGHSIIATKHSFIASDKVDQGGGGERLGTVPPELTLSLSRGAEGCRFLAGSRIVFNLPYASPANSSLAYLYVRAYI